MSPENLNLHAPPSRAPYAPAQTDAWALGVLLCALLAHCTPWGSAAPRDPLWAAHVARPGFRATMPVSRAADRVLRAVLAVEPERRWGLRRMREEVERVEEWWMGEEEIRWRGGVVELVAKDAAGVPCEEEEEQAWAELEEADIADERAAAEAWPERGGRGALHAVDAEPAPSTEESDGPVTPEACALVGGGGGGGDDDVPTLALDGVLLLGARAAGPKAVGMEQEGFGKSGSLRAWVSSVWRRAGRV
jgi:hypothetical protein